MKTFSVAAMACVTIIIAAVPTAVSAATTVSLPGAGFSIRDVTSQSSVITVSDNSIVTGVTFSLNGLTHTFINDLRAALIHNGEQVIWLSRSGGGANLNGTYLISDAGVSTLDNASGNPRPSGTYRADESLLLFSGLTAAGDWSLVINDEVFGDVGNLDSWTLNLTTTPGPVPEPATWAMMLVGFGMIGATARYRRRKVAVAFG